MKRTLALLICSSLLAASSAQAAESCWEEAPEPSPNPLIEIITMPMKMVFVLTTLPRCMVASIPKNE